MGKLIVYEADMTDWPSEGRTTERSAAYIEAESKVGPLKPLAGPGALVGDRRAQTARDVLDDPDAYTFLGWQDGKTVIVAIARQGGKYVIVWPDGSPVVRRPGRPSFIANRQEIRISVPSELRDRLRSESQRADISESEIVRAALDAELTRRGG